MFLVVGTGELQRLVRAARHVAMVTGGKSSLTKSHPQLQLDQFVAPFRHVRHQLNRLHVVTTPSVPPLSVLATMCRMNLHFHLHLPVKCSPRQSSVTHWWPVATWRGLVHLHLHLTGPFSGAHSRSGRVGSNEGLPKTDLCRSLVREFYMPDALPVTQPTVSNWRNLHSRQLLTEKNHAQKLSTRVLISKRRHAVWNVRVIMQWLQLWFRFDWTAIRRPSTAYQRWLWSQWRKSLAAATLTYLFIEATYIHT